MSDADTKILDLDALEPVKAIVKLGDQEIEVKPPSTADVLRLGSLGGKLEKAADLPVEELETLINEITALIKRCVPELGDRALNTAQLMKLTEMIGEMAMPPDAKELEARGVTTSDPKAQ